MAAQITENQFVTLSNGMRLHYASAGNAGKPLILFVHGFPEFWFAWHAQLADFGVDFYAVAPDLRGFNLSDQPADVAAYRARHIVDDLRLLVNHLGYQRCILVAHDWGGAVAWNMAIAMPQLLERLVIINAPHPWLFAQALVHDPRQQQASAYMNWLRKPGVENALAADDYRQLESIMLGMAPGAAGWFDDETRKRYHLNWSRGLTGGLNYYRASPMFPPTATDPGPARLPLNAADFRVSVPTLVIWGERDIALPPSLLDGLEQLVDRLDMIRIPDGSHWVVHEQPDRINGIIRHYLGDTLGRRGAEAGCADG